MHWMFAFLLEIMVVLICGLMTAAGLKGKKEKLSPWIYASIPAVAAIPVIFYKLYIENLIGSIVADVIIVVIFAIYAFMFFSDTTIKKVTLTVINALIAVADCAVMWVLDANGQVVSYNAKDIVVILSTETGVLLICYGIFVIVWNIVFKIRKIVPYIWVFVFFPISQIITIKFLNGKVENNPFFDDFISCFGVLLGYVADLILFYVLLHHHGEKAEIKRRLEEIERVNELEQAHYEAMNKRRKEVDEVKEEFEGQLAAVYEMIEQGNQTGARTLLEQLKTDIAATKEYEYCENPVVNAVLTEKASICREKGIEIEIDVNMKAKSKIEPVHICSIYSNMLDNAINACDSFDGKKYISIHDGMAGDYLNVKVVNSSDKPSRKAHREGHGYGQKILKDIAEQYSGQCTFGWKNNEYRAMISLLVEE